MATGAAGKRMLIILTPSAGAWHSAAMLFALAAIFATSFVLALSGAMMPGPLLTTTISESVRSGRGTGAWLVLGHAILELALILALIFGLAPLLARDGVFCTVALSGAVILGWMARGMFKSLPTLTIRWQSRGEPTGHLVRAGILVSLSNPYWSIWWATIGLTYILTCRKYGLAGIAAFFLGHILADLVWYSLVSVIVAQGRSFLTVARYRAVMACCASFLVIFAGYFLYSGVARMIPLR
jgi:threonine/homoserine/homoserine lactone efflux protein